MDLKTIADLFDREAPEHFRKIALENQRKLAEHLPYSGNVYNHYRNKKMYRHIGEATFGGFDRTSCGGSYITQASHTEEESKLSIYMTSDGKFKYVHSHDIGELTIYMANYEDLEYGFGHVWARPTEMFYGLVEHDGKEVKRFQLNIDRSDYGVDKGNRFA